MIEFVLNLLNDVLANTLSEVMTGYVLLLITRNKQEK